MNPQPRPTAASSSTESQQPILAPTASPTINCAMDSYTWVNGSWALSDKQHSARFDLEGDGWEHAALIIALRNAPEAPPVLYAGGAAASSITCLADACYDMEVACRSTVVP